MCGSSSSRSSSSSWLLSSSWPRRRLGACRAGAWRNCSATAYAAARGSSTSWPIDPATSMSFSSCRPSRRSPRSRSCPMSASRASRRIAAGPCGWRCWSSSRSWWSSTTSCSASPRARWADSMPTGSRCALRGSRACSPASSAPSQPSSSSWAMHSRPDAATARVPSRRRRSYASSSTSPRPRI